MKLIGTSAWLALAKLADAVERSRSTLDVSAGWDNTWSAGERVGEPRRAYVARLAIEHDIPDPLDEHGNWHGAHEREEAHQLAERLAMRWMDIAQSKAHEPAPMPEHVEKRDCPMCKAAPQQWCKPIHAGERDGGGWSHPVRKCTSDSLKRLADEAKKCIAHRGTGYSNRHAIEDAETILSLIAWVSEPPVMRIRGDVHPETLQRLRGHAALSRAIIHNSEPRRQTLTPAARARLAHVVDRYRGPARDLTAVELRANWEAYHRSYVERLAWDTAPQQLVLLSAFESMQGTQLETAAGMQLDRLAEALDLTRWIDDDAGQVESDIELRARALQQRQDLMNVSQQL